MNSCHRRAGIASLEAALAGSDLLGLGVDASQEDSVVVRERVHRTEGNVEARLGVVNRDDVDRRAVVRELPAGAALVRVEARDDGGATDVREVRQRAEGREALGEHTVRAVRARNGGQGAIGVVVRLVVGHRDRGGGRGRRKGSGGSEDEGGDSSEELHCDRVGKGGKGSN